MKQAALLLSGLLAITVAGCGVKQKAHEFSDSASNLASNTSKAVERLGTSAGTKLGLIEKKYDYVALAYQRTDAPEKIKVPYTQEEERFLGMALAAELFKRYPPYQDEELQTYLTRVANVLASCSDRPDLPALVTVVQTEQPLCHALPGGLILISLGALRCCDTEAEIAGLLAQAWGHEQLRHPLELLEKVTQADANLAQFDSISALKMPDLEFSTLIQTTAAKMALEGLPTNRIKTAGAVATRLLTRVGYEPGGLKAYLEQEQIFRRKKNPNAPLKDLGVYKDREAVIDAELAELHVPGGGQSLAERYRQECYARLPAP